MLIEFQVYTQLQGHAHYMFDVSSGLLLRKDQREAFDAQRWSLYLKDCLECLIEERVLNGKPLPPERFRDYDRPDQVLVAWHYAQTVMMRTRGQSVGMIHR